MNGPHIHPDSQVDAEVTALVQGAYEEARAILQQHLEQLHLLAIELRDKKALTVLQICALLDMGPQESQSCPG